MLIVYTYIELMKKILLISHILYSSLFAQGNVYPVETSYGGGIGFGNMYMILNEVPGASVLDSIGFNVDDLQTRPLVFYGGEGFAQMIGPWRLGGYAGIGSAQISNVYDIQLYKNEVGGGVGYDPGVDTPYPFNDNLSVKGKLNILLGAMTAEYVFPIYRDLEVMAGALMGLGSYNLSVDQHIGTPKWNDIGKSKYGYLSGDSLVYVRVDSQADADEIRNEGLKLTHVNESMTEISSLFFNFQPYVAVKWQFLDRMGLRMSAGFNRGTIGAGRWRLNGNVPINDSPEASISGFTVRTVIYFGL